MINKLSVCFILISVLFSSCSSKFSVHKRRYTKGYYFAHATKPPAVKEKAIAPGKENTQPVVAGNSAEAVSALLAAESFSNIQEAAPEQSRQQPAHAPLKTGKAKADRKISLLPALQQDHHKKTADSQESEQPYDYWGGGGSMLFYIGSVIASLIIFGLFFLFMELLFEGVIGIWILGLLALVVLAAIVVIAVLIAMNSD